MNKIRFVKYGFGVVLAGVSAYGIAKGASSASLQWNSNPDPLVTGYNVYYGGATHAYTNMLSVGNTTNAEVGGLMEGRTYFFAVTAYDSFGNESDYSAGNCLSRSRFSGLNARNASRGPDSRPVSGGTRPLVRAPGIGRFTVVDYGLADAGCIE